MLIGDVNYQSRWNQVARSTSSSKTSLAGPSKKFLGGMSRGEYAADFLHRLGHGEEPRG